MTRPVFGQMQCKSCRGKGVIFDRRCPDCDGAGWTVPLLGQPPAPQPKSEKRAAPEPPSAPTGEDTGPVTDTHPRENVEACKRAHTNRAIAAYVLEMNGHISAYDSVYEGRCPWCAFPRRNTRLADTIYHLKRDYGWDIETVTKAGGMADYVLRH